MPAMRAALTRRPSQAAFEDALREHLAGHAEGAAVPGVNGVRAGINLAALDDVRERLGLSPEMLERTLSVSTRTLQRRRQGEEQRLTAAESDRLWRLLHIFNRALEAFTDDEEAARKWLTTPKTLLRGETPLERLDTEPGLREVEDMLTVIDETAAA